MSFHSRLKSQDLHSPSRELVANTTGSTIEGLRCVALISQPGTIPLVEKINSPTTQVVRGVTELEITTGQAGFMTSLGFMQNVDTSPWTVGTRLYSTINGSLSIVQVGLPVATVLRQDATTGILYVDNTGITQADIASSVITSGWKTDGNVGTNPAINFLGTADAEALVLRTSNSERMRIDENGRFGFGTIPENFFHIKSHSNFPLSGHQTATFAGVTNSTSLTPIYSYGVPIGVTCIITVVVAARESSNHRAVFRKTVGVFRDGPTAQKIEQEQSDFTSRSNGAFEAKFIISGPNMTLRVKAPTASETSWTGTITIDCVSTPT